MHRLGFGAIAAFSLTALSAQAEPVEVTGMVAYREGMMLPPAAVTTVRLVERGDPGRAFAEVSVADRRAPPIPFTLTYDSGLIDPAIAYALDARISVDGRTLFAGDEPQPVADPLTSRKTSIVVRLQRPEG